jgi:hypothetical protein
MTGWERGYSAHSRETRSEAQTIHCGALAFSHPILGPYETWIRITINAGHAIAIGCLMGKEGHGNTVGASDIAQKVLGEAMAKTHRHAGVCPTKLNSTFRRPLSSPTATVANANDERTPGSLVTSFGEVEEYAWAAD